MVVYLYADDGGRMQSPVSEPVEAAWSSTFMPMTAGGCNLLSLNPVEAAWSPTFMPMTPDGCNHLSLNLVEAAAGRH